MFREPNTSACVLCGSAQRLTGEHKIKASALRKEFGDAKLVVGVSDGEAPMRFVQSTNSKNLKFRSRLCEPCNTWRTQVADRAFEALHARVRELYEESRNIDEFQSDELMAVGSPQYVNTFRYFSKILACHIAEMGAPVLNELCDFAIGKSDFNPVNFRVKLDHTYALAAVEFGDLEYAAHGGVIVFGDKNTHLPTTFYSTLTIGPIQYCFEAQLNLFGQARLMIECPEFFLWCKQRIEEAIESRMTDGELHRAGLND